MAEIVYGYARVSTDEQDNSFENQKHKIETYFHYHQDQGGFQGCEFGGVFADEDVSGGIPMFNRPAGSELYDRLNNEDHIVATHLDRCFRGVVDALLTQQSLMERGIYLHIIAVGIDFSTPWGKMMFANLATYAEFERDMIRMRTKDAMSKKKREGTPVNRFAPIGYRKVGEGKQSKFLPNYDERELANSIVHWRDVDEITWSQCVKRLIFTKRESTGGDWSQENVRRAYDAAKNNFPLFDLPDPFTVTARMERHKNLIGVDDE